MPEVEHEKFLKGKLIILPIDILDVDLGIIYKEEFTKETKAYIHLEIFSKEIISMALIYVHPQE